MTALLIASLAKVALSAAAVGALLVTLRFAGPRAGGLAAAIPVNSTPALMEIRMRPKPIRAVSMPVLLIQLLGADVALADDGAPRRLGDHPAVVVQRMQRIAGYDYLSKFYPHPAGLHLLLQAPREENGTSPTDDRQATSAVTATAAASSASVSER
jgi:hypothetical protein